MKVTYSGFNENKWYVGNQFENCGGSNVSVNYYSYIGINDLNATYYAKVNFSPTGTMFIDENISNPAVVTTGYWRDDDLKCAKGTIGHNPIIGGLHGTTPSNWTIGINPAYRTAAAVNGLIFYGGGRPQFGKLLFGCVRPSNNEHGPAGYEFKSFAEWKLDFDSVATYTCACGPITINIEAVVL